MTTGECRILRKNRMLELAASYVGAVVGAGFASGQEQVHFFFPMRFQLEASAGSYTRGDSSWKCPGFSPG
jgi:hypothetical protein